MSLMKPPGLVCGLDKRVLLSFLVSLHFIFKGTGGHISSSRCGQTLRYGTIMMGPSILMNGMPVYWTTVEGNWLRWQVGDRRRRARAIERVDGMRKRATRGVIGTWMMVRILVFLISSVIKLHLA
jgi:hypothetical protein